MEILVEVGLHAQ